MGCGSSSYEPQVYSQSYPPPRQYTSTPIHVREYQPPQQHQQLQQYQQPQQYRPPMGNSNSTSASASVRSLPQSSSSVTSAGGRSAAAAPEPVGGRPVTMEEVKQHHTASDCWVVVRGVAYDVTRFLKNHPGGAGVMTAWAGRDATAAFEDAHSYVNPQKTLRKFIIGPVTGA